jgi:hypothetical protein
MLGVDDAQPARTHCDVFAEANNGVGYIPAVQDAIDQAADRNFGLRPPDRNRNSAHVTRPCFQPCGSFRQG